MTMLADRAVITSGGCGFELFDRNRSIAYSRWLGLKNIAARPTRANLDGGFSDPITDNVWYAQQDTRFTSAFLGFDVPRSAMTTGFIPLRIIGLDGSTYSQEVIRTADGRAVIGSTQVLPRPITFEGVIVGATCCAVQDYKRALNQRLISCLSCDGVDIRLWICDSETVTPCLGFGEDDEGNPEGPSSQDFPEEIRTLCRVALTSGVKSTGEIRPNSGCQCDGATIDVVRFTVTAADPHLYSDPIDMRLIEATGDRIVCNIDKYLEILCCPDIESPVMAPKTAKPVEVKLDGTLCPIGWVYDEFDAERCYMVPALVEESPEGCTPYLINVAYDGLGAMTWERVNPNRWPEDDSLPCGCEILINEVTFPRPIPCAIDAGLVMGADGIYTGTAAQMRAYAECLDLLTDKGVTYSFTADGQYTCTQPLSPEAIAAGLIVVEENGFSYLEGTDVQMNLYAQLLGVFETGFSYHDFDQSGFYQCRSLPRAAQSAGVFWGDLTSSTSTPQPEAFLVGDAGEMQQYASNLGLLKPPNTYSNFTADGEYTCTTPPTTNPDGSVTPGTTETLCLPNTPASGQPVYFQYKTLPFTTASGQHLPVPEVKCLPHTPASNDPVNVVTQNGVNPSDTAECWVAQLSVNGQLVDIGGWLATTEFPPPVGGIKIDSACPVECANTPTCILNIVDTGEGFRWDATGDPLNPDSTRVFRPGCTVILDGQEPGEYPTTELIPDPECSVTPNTCVIDGCNRPVTPDIPGTKSACAVCRVPLMQSQHCEILPVASGRVMVPSVKVWAGSVPLGNFEMKIIKVCGAGQDTIDPDTFDTSIGETVASFGMRSIPAGGCLDFDTKNRKIVLTCAQEDTTQLPATQNGMLGAYGLDTEEFSWGGWEIESCNCESDCAFLICYSTDAMQTGFVGVADVPASWATSISRREG